MMGVIYTVVVGCVGLTGREKVDGPLGLVESGSVTDVT